MGIKDRSESPVRIHLRLTPFVFRAMGPSGKSGRSADDAFPYKKGDIRVKCVCNDFLILRGLVVV